MKSRNLNIEMHAEWYVKMKAEIGVIVFRTKKHERLPENYHSYMRSMANIALYNPQKEPNLPKP